MPNLRDTEKYRNTIWDYTFANGLFADPGIKIGDIDGAVMWKGELLIVEFKSPHATSIAGQQLLFGRLLMRGHCTIIIVEGETNKPQRMKVGTTFGIHGPDTQGLPKIWGGWESCNLDCLQTMIQFWSESADANPEYGYVPDMFFPDVNNAPELVHH